MKVRHVYIDNFKGIKDLEVRVADADGPPRRLTCLIGDNGSGKTTALQAIALVLSLATRRTRQVTDFRWHGFLPERVSSQGKTFVQVTVELDQDEVDLTHDLFEEWYAAQSTEWQQTHRVVPPSGHRVVELVYDGVRLSSPLGFEAVNQFLGRYYIKWLSRLRPAAKDQFTQLGDVFWFDQYRNLGTALAEREPDGGDRHAEVESWSAGVEQLREFLVAWWAFYKSPAFQKGQGQDYVKKLEQKFNVLFPGTTFQGTAPRDGVAAPGPKDFYFLLQRGERLYDAAEMSSGEQAIFSLLYDFVRLRISKSVVLIDELELHLHPPTQQALLATLPTLGTDCQFFVTTHSEFLTGAIPDESEVRLEGGRRCL